MLFLLFTSTQLVRISDIFVWLRAKQRIIRIITFNSDNGSFVLPEIEYHSWNLFQNELPCARCINKCHMQSGTQIRRKKGTGGRGNFFRYLPKKLFVGKIR